MLSRKNRIRHRFALETLVIMFVLGFFASQALASSSPLETVRTGTNKVLHILKGPGGSKQQQRAEIRKIADQYFDFHMMSRRALGSYWKKLTPAKQQEYVKAFSQFLFNRYIDKVEKYTNQKISYQMKGKSGSYAIVDVVITGSQTGRIPIAYRLHQTSGKWRAYDVVIQGVSLVNNYRSQFRSILARKSFAYLMQRLKQKNSQNQ